MIQNLPRSPLFHYTTLFRSKSTFVPRMLTDEELRKFFHAVDALEPTARSEEHTSELQSHHDLVCRLLLEKKNEQDNVIENRVEDRRMCNSMWCGGCTKLHRR